MSYFATVCYLTDIREHPNADRLLLANALGYNVIVGKDAREDELGVVFPEGGRLSHNMLFTNSFYRKNPMTGELMGGYFEENGRIKAIKLRGAQSEAFWTPLSSLIWTGVALLELKPGDTIDCLNSEKVCEKYYTQATLRVMLEQTAGQGKKCKRAEDYAPSFTRHFDTAQFRDAVSFFVGTEQEFIVTEKLHGTSARTGFVPYTKRNRWQNFLAKLHLYKDKYRLVSGTRRVVLDPDSMSTDTGYYSGSEFRYRCHKFFEGKLLPDEIVHYEIVGYTDNGKLIMGEHGLNKASLKEAGIPEKELSQYGDSMKYTYGCNFGEYQMFVYRITRNGVDLPFNKMFSRCIELQINSVPYIGKFRIKPEMTVQDIMTKVNEYTKGQSMLDSGHISEGVCLRQDRDTGIKVWKFKGFLFCVLEGIRKNTDSYVDMEEVG